MQVKSSIIHLPQSSTAKRHTRIQGVTDVTATAASNKEHGHHKQLQVIPNTHSSSKFEKIDLRNVMTGDVPGYAKKAINQYQETDNILMVGENLNVKV